MAEETRSRLSVDSPLQDNLDLPLVSVCIPAYNSEDTLADTLESVLEQDYPRIEIVVSDNQSTDHTKAIVLRYAERGVRYSWHSEGRPAWAATLASYIGVFANWNHALSQGRGEYRCLFHSDDLYEPSIVRQQVAIMQLHPQVGAIFTRMQPIGEDGRPIRMKTSELPNDLRKRTALDFPTLLNAVLAQANFLPAPSVMLRRSVIDEVGGFDERNFLTSADLEMWLRIAWRGHDIVVINEPLLKCRFSEGHISNQYGRSRTTVADFFRVVDHYLAQPGVRAGTSRRSYELYELGRACDRVRCAMNLLVQEKLVEARGQLRASLGWRQFGTALRRPRTLALLLTALILFACIPMGLGIVGGRLVRGAWAHFHAWRRRPVR